MRNMKIPLLKISSLMTLLVKSQESINLDTSTKTSTSDFPIIGPETKSTWTPPSRAFSWFTKVADIDVPDSQLESYLEDFVPPKELENHFTPPRLPKSVWDKLLRSKRNEELNKQRHIYQSQKLLYSSLMPLLTVLESTNSNDPNQKLISTAIQMICTSNLRLNKFRRSAISSFIKPELRQSLFEQPATHDHLFGTDFNNSAELAIKNQSSITKVWSTPKKRFFKPFSNNPSNPPVNPTFSRNIPPKAPTNTLNNTPAPRSSSFDRPSKRPFRPNSRGKRSYPYKQGTSSRGSSHTQL